MHIVLLILAKIVFWAWAYYTKAYRNWPLYAYWGPFARAAREGFMRRRREQAECEAEKLKQEAKPLDDGTTNEA